MIKTHLRHSLVVDGDQVSRLWVNLQALVERQGSLNGARRVSTQLLAHGHLVQEVRLLLLDARGEAFIFGIVNDLLNSLALVQGLDLGLDLGLSRLPPLITTQLSSELWLAASCVIEVDGISWNRPVV